MPTQKIPAPYFSRAMLAALLLLGVAVLSMYGLFLRNPLVFDDVNVLDGQIHQEYLNTFFRFNLRWLPYATFEWTRAALGTDLIWQRLGNLVLHGTNGLLLFVFVQRLSGICLSTEVKPGIDAAKSGTSRLTWFAFAGAALFLLHPAAVYGVAYLVQRTILMASFFSLLMWLLFLEGSVRKNPLLLWGSVLCYGLAVLSKEHAVMAPAVAAALLVLLSGCSWQTCKRHAPVFLAYALIGAFVVVQLRHGQVIGQVYEPRGGQLLSAFAQAHAGFDPKLAYPLSILTQSFLFFKYLLLWIAPNPLWMSVDMVEPFALKLIAWPHTVGFLGFLLYFAIVLRWLFLRGGKGLAGFAMLTPCLMFAPEFSTVRIQESFVIYRSYLWMAVPVACLPFLFLRIEPRRAAVMLAALIVVMLPATWNRLTTFSNELLLWNDAARLVRHQDHLPGVERIYLNRGIAFYEHGRPDEAIQDLNRALAVTPWNIAAITSRGAAFLALDKIDDALRDFSVAVRLNPQYAQPYLGKGRAHELRGEAPAARDSYQSGCRLGSDDACREFQRVNAASQPLR
jgi:hypothetical protein